jgi:hypothetical protein
MMTHLRKIWLTIQFWKRTPAIPVQPNLASKPAHDLMQAFVNVLETIQYNAEVHGIKDIEAELLAVRIRHWLYRRRFPK